MVRITRKLPDRMTISELESQRAGAISPQEAARAAAAPYAALSDMADSAGRAVSIVREHEKRLEEKENRRKTQLAEMKLKLAWTEHKNDPDWQEQTIEEGIPTQQTMRERWTERKESAQAIVETITDEEERAKFQEIFDVAIAGANLDAASLELQRREQTDSEITWDMTRIAANNQDWPMVDELLSEMLDSNYITQPQFDSETRRYDAERTTAEASAVLDGYRDAQMLGEDEATAAYELLVKNPHPDEDTQAKIIAGASQLNAQFARTRSAEKDRVIGDEIFGEQEWVEVLRAGEDVDLKALRHAGLFSDDPVRNNQTYNRLRDEQLRIQDSVSTGIDARAMWDAGEPFPNTKPYMEAVEGLVNNLLIEEGVPPEIYDEAKAQIYFGTRLIGQRDSEYFEIALKDPDTMVRMAPLFAKLTSDPSRGIPEMGISDKAYLSNIMFRDRNFSGANARETAEEVMELTLVDDEKRRILEKAWVEEDFEIEGFELTSDSGREQSREMFDRIIDKNYSVGIEDDEGEVALPLDAQHYIDFSSYMRDGFLLSNGDANAAAKFARDKFLKSHPETNINGFPQIQKNGIGGDSSPLRSMYLNEIGGVTFQIKGADGKWGAGRVDPDGITLENPFRDERGVTYKVFYNGQPLPEEVVIDSAGNETVIGEQVTFDADDLRRVDAYTTKESVQAGLDRQLEENREAQEKYARTEAVATGPNPRLAGAQPIGELEFEGERTLLKAEKAESERKYLEQFPDL